MLRTQNPREPYNALPRYLQQPLAEVVASVSEVEFISARDIQIFQDWITYEIEKAQQHRMQELARKDQERTWIRKAARESLNDKAFRWVRENAKPGMLIKVTGSRDGLGYREIMEIRDSAVNYHSNVLICYQLDSNGKRKQIVEVMWNKFRGLIEFGDPVEYPGTSVLMGRTIRRQREVKVTTLQQLLEAE